MVVTRWLEAVQLQILRDWPPNESWSLDRLNELLLEANRTCAEECLHADGAISLCLSGGLDSSLSIAMVRSQFPDVPLHAFTVGAHEGHPDVVSARQVAALVRAEHHVLIPTEEDVEAARQEPGIRTLGNAAVFLCHAFIRSLGHTVVLAHDGIDELMGGYWSHRASDDPQVRENQFEFYWGRLAADHLVPLEDKARHHSIRILFPYLQVSVVEYVRGIPLAERTSRAESKMPLRRLGERYGLPEVVLKRDKTGFVNALDSTAPFFRSKP